MAAPVVVLAADCDLGTYNVPADECQVTSTITTSGTFAFNHTLHILAGGRIHASGGSITLNVNGAAGLNFIMANGTRVDGNDDSGPSARNITIRATGNMLMGAGSKITAENNGGGGSGGNISIDVNGDMTMNGVSGGTSGAKISTRKNTGAGDTGVGGNISITVGDPATATGDLTLGGGATGYGAETGATIDATGTGPSGDISINVAGNYHSSPGSLIRSGGVNGSAIQQGGKIYVVVGCVLTSRGRISSKGTDFGADLVHLEGCDVLIQGLVESTGKGHASNAKNSCDAIDDGLSHEVIRSGKPSNATGCIEVWGKNVTIDSTDGHKGELNADIGNGGPGGTSWIDVFALSKIVVTDGTGNDRDSNNLGHTYHSTYAVHANAISGSDDTPGVVTAKVKEGPLTASGKAFQASTTGNGSDGGAIDVEAAGNVTLDHAFLDASGDLDDSPNVDGGSIVVSAWASGKDLSWKPGDGDVRPDVGTIALNACGTIGTDVTTQFHGVTPTTSHTCSASKPDLPAFVHFNTEAWALCAGPAPELQIVKSPNAGTVNAGENANFTIVVTNLGPGTIDGVVLDDDLPNSGYTWTVVPEIEGCSITDSHLHCDIGSLADGGHFEVTVRTATDSEHCGPLNNTASADGKGVAKVSDDGKITVLCEQVFPDIKVTKVGNGTINAGEDAVFTITVTNLGPGDATLVALEDNLPEGIAWTLGGPDAGDCSIDTSAPPPDHLACTFGTLNDSDDATRTVTLTGHTDSEDCGEIPNTAVVRAANEDQEADGNNSAHDTIIVNCQETPNPLLTITKTVAGTTPDTAGHKTAKPGDTLTYTLTYNLTNGPVTNGVITDTIPAGLTYVTGSATGNAEFTFDTGSVPPVLTWNAPTVSADGSVTFKVTVDEDAADIGTIKNVATIDSEETAPDEDDVTVLVPGPVEGATSPPAPPTNIDSPVGGSGGPDVRLPLLLALAGAVMLLASAGPPKRLRRRDRRA